MKGKPNTAHIVECIRNHRDVVVKEIYRAFYYHRQGWMEISSEDERIMSEFLKQRKEERQREWERTLEQDALEYAEYLREVKEEGWL